MDVVVPHLPCMIRMPPQTPYDVFTEQAAESVVGSTFWFVDRRVVVKEAWLDSGDLLINIDEESNAEATDEKTPNQSET